MTAERIIQKYSEKQQQLKLHKQIALAKTQEDFDYIIDMPFLIGAGLMIILVSVYGFYALKCSKSK